MMNKKRIVFWGKEIAILITLAFVLNLVLTVLLITTKGVVSPYMIWAVWLVPTAFIGFWLGYRWDGGVHGKNNKSTKAI